MQPTRVRKGRTRRALIALFVGAALLIPTSLTPSRVDAADTPLSCTNWQSEIVPPKTIRVLRTRTGVVEVLPFKLYVYRTHVAEFWSEYLDQPYSDALLGAGAVAIKQNAWSWTMTPRNWWSVSNFNSTQEGWVRDDYADDNQLNGSAGNPAWSRQRRADENAAVALRMRIRLGADLKDDGIGGLKWDSGSSTYTAPLDLRDDQGNPLPITKKTKRSCFDVVDHPSMNQYYSRGGIYDPGYESGGQSNARYNTAVDATWGITLHRYYPDTSDWRFWRPGFYGSFGDTTDCLLPPQAGDSAVQMRHPTQPSHWRGWSFFPVNADACARDQNLSVDALLRASFFSWEGDRVQGVDTADTSDDRYDITAVTPVRVISPTGDLTGDAKGDLLAVSPSGAVRLISTDPSVDSSGRLNGRAPGSVKLNDAETLLGRIVARTTAGGDAAVVDLRRGGDGGVSLVETPYVAGVLKEATTRFSGYQGFDASATFSLVAADTANDGIQELFLLEVIPQGGDDPTAAITRVYSLPLSGDPIMLGEIPTSSSASLQMADVTGDGVLDAMVLWRASDGSLATSLALGTGAPPVSEWNLNSFSTPGALLWPIGSSWSAATGDLNGDGASELYVRYRDPSGLVRVQSFNLAVRDTTANPDKVYVEEKEPTRSTTVKPGEGKLALVAKRLGVTTQSLIALNSGPSYSVIIKPNDTYAKIAAREKTSDACLRSMNNDKVLVRGATLRAPRDLCVYTEKSVLYRTAPVRTSNGEFDWVRAGDTWETIASRAVTIGVSATVSALTALNPEITIDGGANSAPIGTKVRIRAPWAPLVRVLDPAPQIAAATTLSWNSPFEAWRSVATSSVAPNLYVRDWNGDGIDELTFAAAPAASGVTLQFMTLGADGRLSAGQTVSRTGALAGWTLR
jgi:hypothetical protein